jgi:hypothetical protein
MVFVGFKNFCTKSLTTVSAIDEGTSTTPGKLPLSFKIRRVSIRIFSPSNFLFIPSLMYFILVLPELSDR